MASLEQQLSVPTDVLVSETGDESVLLNLKTERYFGLDDVGTQMWKAIVSNSSLQAAYDALLQQYQVAPETLKQDLLSWVDQLVNAGLLEVAGG